jgi:anti-anti-sigma factor
MIEITSREYKRVHVLRLIGRVDAKTAPELEAALNQHVNAGPPHVVLEMDGTEFLSSAGVRALIAAQKALRLRGGELLIAQPSPRVREVLDLAGLESLFPVYEDTVAAIGSV